MGDSEIKHYKKMAEHCERPADVLPNIEMKRQFKERAQRWRDLAKQPRGTTSTFGPTEKEQMPQQSLTGNQWR
jgi:hypothetical protein